MEVLITNSIESLLFPPGGIFVVLVLSLVLLRTKPVLAKTLISVSLVAGYLLSTPLVSGWLIATLQSYPALTADDLEKSNAQAIVVLASGRYQEAPEYGGVDTVGNNTLLRIRYGAYLHRATGLPVLVSGGNPGDDDRLSLAQVMANSLKDDFQVETVWQENKSRTTAENAGFSQLFLAEKEIETVLLVTQAWHMPRSVVIFEQSGLKVTPAPTAFIGAGTDDLKLSDVLPGARSLLTSRYALHEWVGRLWYLIRH